MKRRERACPCPRELRRRAEFGLSSSEGRSESVRLAVPAVIGRSMSSGSPRSADDSGWSGLAGWGGSRVRESDRTAHRCQSDDEEAHDRAICRAGTGGESSATLSDLTRSSTATLRYGIACAAALRHRLPCLVTTPPALQEYGATRDASRLDFSRLRLPRLAVLVTHHEQAGRRHSLREEHLPTKSSDRSRCLITGGCRACLSRRDRPSTSLDEAGVGHGVGAASVRHGHGILDSMRARFHVKRGPGGRWVYWWSRTAFSARAA